MRMHVSALPLAAAALLAVTAGCSTATSSSTASTGSTASTQSTGSTGNTGSTGSTGQAGQVSPSASPGHDTPQDAVAGVFDAELSGRWSQLCTYLSPTKRSSCVSLSSTPTGHLTVGGAVISGDLALVKVTGTICMTGNGCASNTNPSTGMPTRSKTFRQAYENALNGSSTFSPVPCIKINGTRYVNTASQ